MSLFDETPDGGRGASDAGASPFLISAFPGGGGDHLLAELAARPGLCVAPPAPWPGAPDPADRPEETGAHPDGAATADRPEQEERGGRRVALTWRPGVGGGLALVRNPFHVLAELSAGLGAAGPAQARARGTLLRALAAILSGSEEGHEPGAEGMVSDGLALDDTGPDDTAFAALVAGLWARHARALLASGLPLLQLERFAAAPEAWAAHVAACAIGGAPLPEATDALLLPAASVRAEQTGFALSDAQVSAIVLVAADALRACGYQWHDGGLAVRPAGPVAAVPAAGDSPIQAQLRTHGAAIAGLSGQVRRALEAGRRREQTLDVMGQVIADLCRQQEASFKASQQELADRAAEAAQARHALDLVQARTAHLQRELSAIRGSGLTLSDLDVAPPTAKFVRLGEDVIEVGRTKNTPARISLTLPAAPASNWIVVLSVTVEAAGGEEALPPLGLSYASGPRNRRLRLPVAVGDNLLMFILSGVNENATASLLIEPRAAPYLISDLAFIPLTMTAGRGSAPAEAPDPAEEEAPELEAPEPGLEADEVPVHAPEAALPLPAAPDHQPASEPASEPRAEPGADAEADAPPVAVPRHN
ncbi:hypothetical protein V5F53_20915 [Xanthobacter sp. V4C-4]|uniref:hypothetical protein n=1 Tax=Xanthobacter cornucopiae TaxID=3119924 RepID=UPI003726D2E5